MSKKKTKGATKMLPEEVQMWQALRKKCHTHDNESKRYTRKQKHKKEISEND